jgi:hypothetical protein
MNGRTMSCSLPSATFDVRCQAPDVTTAGVRDGLASDHRNGRASAADPRVEGRPTRVSHPCIAGWQAMLAQVWKDVGDLLTPHIIIIIEDGAMVVRSSG